MSLSSLSAPTPSSTLRLSLLTSLAALALSLPLFAVVVGCDGTEFVVAEPEPEDRVIGDPCVVDDECETGRCVGGTCTDGLCQEDAECRSDELCVFGECIPADDFACQTDQRPLININPLNVEFGEVALGNVSEQVVTIENVGDCLLTLEGVGLESNAPSGFSCDPCDVSSYPQRVPPQRSVDVTVRYAPESTGEAISNLLIRSDDSTAGDEDGVIAVGLHATYSGVPQIVIDPPELFFGTVNQGTEVTETVTITNQGSGNAVLTIQGIYITGDDDFSIPTEFAAIEPPSPLLLPPYDPNNPDTIIEVPVTLRPTRLANFEAELKVQAHYGDPTAADRFSTSLTGTSLGPPQISVSTTELVYQQDDGTAYPVGTVAFRQVTISNSGQSPLNVNMNLSDDTGDFTVSPPFVPPVAPGGSVVVSVFFNPSEPSDSVNPHEPTTPTDAFLNITSNDDDPLEDVLKVVALRGWARGGVFDDVLKLEMTFQNAENSWAGSDYRDVDLELLSPTGFSCTKPVHQYSPDGSGGFIVTSTEDLCDDWNAYDVDNDGRPEEGSVNWIALGQYEEPERILLYGLGQDLAEGRTFTARVHYVEDCANIPSGILGDILGIGASVLLGALGGAVGVPIAVPPDQISDLITENCWDHESSNVTLAVFLNGEQVASPSHRLRDKGDFFDIVKLRRENGQFEILP